MDNNTSQDKRQSNIELLRILAMLFIIAYHFVYHGDVYYPHVDISGFNRIFTTFLRPFGKMGVNIFVMISGYFLITSQKSNIPRLIRLWLQTLFYSAGIAIILIAKNYLPFSAPDLAARFSPITRHLWWFSTAYFVLHLFSPFINKFLNTLTKAEYTKMLVLMTAVFSIVPSLNNISEMGHELTWFVFIYSIGGYVRLHTDNKPKRPAKYILYAVLFQTAVLFLCKGLAAIGFKNPLDSLYALYSFSSLVSSLLIFRFFLGLDIKTSRIINALASAAFGVYLLHEDEFMRIIIWNVLVKPQQYIHDPLLPLHIIKTALLIYAIGGAIELIRKNLLEKHYMPPVYKLADFLDPKINAFFKK